MATTFRRSPGSRSQAWGDEPASTIPPVGILGRAPAIPVECQDERWRSADRFNARLAGLATENPIGRRTPGCGLYLQRPCLGQTPVNCTSHPLGAWVAY